MILSKTRLMVLARDNYTCQHCFKTGKKLDIHHIIPSGESKGMDVINNLISVCRGCHRRIEYFVPRFLKKPRTIMFSDKFDAILRKEWKQYGLDDGVGLNYSQYVCMLIEKGRKK